MEKNITIRYIANAGLIIESERCKIILDGICKDEHDFYKSTPAHIINDMISNKEPYDNIDFILYTHSHMDHYDKNMN